MNKLNQKIWLTFVLALSASKVWAQNTNANQTIYSSPFANVPLHLDSKTIDEIKPSPNRVKPNIMLFIDDSGSMRYGINGRDKNVFMGRQSSKCPRDKLKGSNTKVDPTRLCFSSNSYDSGPSTKNNLKTISSNSFGAFENENFDDGLPYPKQPDTPHYYYNQNGKRYYVEKKIENNCYDEGFLFLRNGNTCYKGTRLYNLNNTQYYWITSEGKKSSPIEKSDKSKQCMHEGVLYYKHTDGKCYHGYRIYEGVTKGGNAVYYPNFSEQSHKDRYYRQYANVGNGVNDPRIQPLYHVLRSKIYFDTSDPQHLVFKTRDTNEEISAANMKNSSFRDKVTKGKGDKIMMHCKDDTNLCYRIYDKVMDKSNQINKYSFKASERNNVRILVTLDAIHNVLDQNGDIANWNVSTLWGSDARFDNDPVNGDARTPVSRAFSDANSVRKYVNAISPYSGTPTTWRYVDTVQTVYDNMDYRCRKNFVILFSDGDANGSESGDNNIHTKIWDSKYSSLSSIYNELFGKTNAVVNNNSEPRLYLKSTGGIYNPNSEKYGEGLSIISQALYSKDLKTNGVDKEGVSWDELKDEIGPNGKPTGRKVPMKQNIETFTIGFGNGISSTGKAYLQHAATGGECKGNTIQGNDKTGKCYFAANDAGQLKSAFDKIFQSIRGTSAYTPDDTTTFSISTPSATGASSSESATVLTLDTTRWASELKFAKFDKKGKIIKDSSGKTLLVGANYLNRKFIVNDGSKSAFLNPNDANQARLFGLGPKEYKYAFYDWIARNPNVSDSKIEENIKAKEAELKAARENRVVKNYRVRTINAADDARQMADVVGSPTVAIGRDSNNRQKYVVTAANDGMVYIFKSEEIDSLRADKPYSLALNYLPAAMQRQSKDSTLTVGKALPALADSEYGRNLEQPHIYLNNGGIAWIKTPNTGKMPQQYNVVGNLGQGARGSYALTIAGQDRAGNGAAGLDAGEANYLAKVPLWETEKGPQNMLGYTISSPIIGQVATQIDGTNNPDTGSGVRLLAFIANGYSSEVSGIPYDSSPTLYAYDLLGQEFGTNVNSSNLKTGTAGARVAKLSVPFNKAGALSTPVLLDSNLDGLADFAFAGDSLGNLWRFDLRGNPKNWNTSNNVDLIYQGLETQPITAAPAIYKADDDGKFIVIFGTGSDIFEKDQRDINQQMIMGIKVDTKDDSPTALTSASPEILDQTLEDKSGQSSSTKEEVQVRVLSTTPISDDKKAWRIKLSQSLGQSSFSHTDKDKNKITSTVFRSSEKVTTQPQLLLGSVYVTSRVYKFETEVKEYYNPARGKNITTCYDDHTATKTETNGESWLMTLDAKSGGNPLKEDGYSYLADFDDKENPNKPVAGVNLGYLSSSVSLFNRDAFGKDILQTDPHGSISSGEVINLETAKNVLGELRRNCIDNNANYEALLSIADSSGKDIVKNFSIDGSRCPSGESFIRVNIREIPF